MSSDFEDEKQYHAPSQSRNIILSAISFAWAFIAIAVILAPEGRSIDYHFASERGLITALSAYLLAAASAFSLATCVTIRASSYTLWPWLLMSLGFMFLSIDEIAQFHERIGSFIGDSLAAGPFRNWNDVIVIAYGAIALPILYKLLPAIAPFKLTVKLLGVAFLMYALHTFIDSTQSPPTAVSRILEESAKLLCGVFLALSMFFGFYARAQNQTTNMN